jgi:Protein of unknown function (DUF2958)
MGCRRDSDSPLGLPAVATSLWQDVRCTWLLTELGLGDIAFGLCDLGMGCLELGFVSMHELRDLRGPLGLPVERDMHFEADKTLSAYAADAREHGRIVT